MKEISRRDFLKLTKKAAIILGASTVGLINRTKDKKIIKPEQVRSQNDLIARANLQGPELGFGTATPSPAEIIQNFKDFTTWKETDRPVYLAIPDIDYTSSIQLADDVQLASDHKTFKVPDSGIATPKNPIKNNIFIFGHSRWENMPQPFAQIAELDKNDEIIITNEQGKYFRFAIVKFQLVNYMSDEIDLGSFEKPVLTLQTTARTTKGWLLNENEIMQKVGLDQPEPIGKRLLLLIIAKPK